jgi:hypothetical protein
VAAGHREMCAYRSAATDGGRAWRAVIVRSGALADKSVMRLGGIVSGVIPCESGNPDLAADVALPLWIPAFAGMTRGESFSSASSQSDAL